ncbi:Aste57867_10615 [Aphanomyces stellatus]|uniref:Aste57867_10615 protein n=1 Tax=Aphanomyces stellatus TaxID=120398 RepID=A0A485KQV3_9STRA|nr:hypothetical protein As57867_010575 [Aphanomyces stellatus]VFT87487.1 Aste57867_10615 [Aphanomyces stellatus]
MSQPAVVTEERSAAAEASEEDALRLQISFLQSDLHALQAEKDAQEALLKLRILFLEREIQTLKHAAAIANNSTRGPPTSSNGRKWFQSLKKGTAPASRPPNSAPTTRAAHQSTRGGRGGINSTLQTTAEEMAHFNGHNMQHRKGMYQRMLSIFPLDRIRALWRPSRFKQVPMEPPTASTSSSSEETWQARYDNGRVYFVNTRKSNSVNLDLLIMTPTKKNDQNHHHHVFGDSSWV